MNSKQIIVSGASNQVGFFLLPRLIAAGYHIHAWSRKEPASQKMKNDSITWHRVDLDGRAQELIIPEASFFLHLAPVWLIPDLIDYMSANGIKRIVALSSTSRYSKLASGNAAEKATVTKLIAAEDAFISKCDNHGIDWTLLRPTMIYGCGMDKNVTVVARFIRRFGFFPLVGMANGRREPVHADDVASSCVAVMNCPAAYGRAYNLSGGQTLTFREMVEAIFRALGKKPRIVYIPKKLAFFLMKHVSLLPAYRHINREMMERVNQDICFDSSDARRDFGYTPRGFHFLA